MSAQVAVSPKVGSVIRPILPEVTAEIIATIGREVPDYRRPLEGEFGAALTVGVEVALGRFVDQLEGRGEPEDSRRDVYVNLGRAEWHAGRKLESLLNAYRVGARVAWRRMAAEGEAQGVEPTTMYRVGEAIFAYIDEISAESASGHSEEQSAAAGEMKLRRTELALLLERDPPAQESALLAAAELAVWRLPRRVVAAVVSTDNPDWMAGRFGPEALTIAGEGTVTAWFAAPLRKGDLAVAVEERQAAVGPPVPVAESVRSVQRARALHRLTESGRIATPGVLYAENHLPAMLLGAEPEVAAELAERALAPLQKLSPAARERLTVTLRAWLDRPGQVQAIAAELHVHPQTVRYRLRQLRELFGGVLEDPDGRFELALALRAGNLGKSHPA